jgi:hypothetical protein
MAIFWGYGGVDWTGSGLCPNENFIISGGKASHHDMKTYRIVEETHCLLTDFGARNTWVLCIRRESSNAFTRNRIPDVESVGRHFTDWAITPQHLKVITMALSEWDIARAEQWSTVFKFFGAPDGDTCGRQLKRSEYTTPVRKAAERDTKWVTWGCIQKFPDWIDKEIYAYNNKHSLRSNTESYGGKTH